MKRCLSCKEEKPFSYFRKSGFYKEKQKYKPYCSDCRNTTEEYKVPTEKVCNNCGETSPIDEFPKAGMSAKGLSRYRSNCKSCSYKTDRRIGKSKHLKVCLYCKKLHKNEKFCSKECTGNYKTEQTISKWLDDIIPGHKGKALSIKPSIRNFLLKEANYKCEMCSFEGYNKKTNNSILEIDHIDGDASNSVPENLRVLCPNCHATLPTHRALNTFSPRQR